MLHIAGQLAAKSVSRQGSNQATCLACKPHGQLSSRFAGCIVSRMRSKQACEHVSKQAVRQGGNVTGQLAGLLSGRPVRQLAGWQVSMLANKQRTQQA